MNFPCFSGILFKFGRTEDLWQWEQMSDYVDNLARLCPNTDVDAVFSNCGICMLWTHCFSLRKSKLKKKIIVGNIARLCLMHKPSYSCRWCALNMWHCYIMDKLIWFTEIKKMLISYWNSAVKLSDDFFLAS